MKSKQDKNIRNPELFWKRCVRNLLFYDSSFMAHTFFISPKEISVLFQWFLLTTQFWQWNSGYASWEDGWKKERFHDMISQKRLYVTIFCESLEDKPKPFTCSIVLETNQFWWPFSPYFWSFIWNFEDIDSLKLKRNRRNRKN